MLNEGPAVSLVFFQISQQFYENLNEDVVTVSILHGKQLVHKVRILLERLNYLGSDMYNLYAWQSQAACRRDSI